MKLFIGLDHSDYQDVLRALGLYIDEHHYTNVRIFETEDGIVLQGVPLREDGTRAHPGRLRPAPRGPGDASDVGAQAVASVATSPKAARAASNVASTSVSVCAVPRNHTSNCDGGR